MGLSFRGVSTEKISPSGSRRERHFYNRFNEKMQKNNSAQVGQNFQNQLPDNLSGIKNRLPTKLVGSLNPTSVQAGQKLKITSAQVA